MSFAPHSLSWWIAVINAWARSPSALTADELRRRSSAGVAVWSDLFTMVGGTCLLGAYLLIPELFDETPAVAREPSAPR